MQRHDVLDRAVRRAYMRLAPFLMLMYVVSFLDRANVGFAKQALQTSVGISESTYALGAGLFFITYSLCGFPSNLILHRIGAKVWILTRFPAKRSKSSGRLSLRSSPGELASRV